MKYELQNGWKKSIDKDAVFSYAEKYKSFLNEAKTEREAVCECVRLAKENGFKNIEDVETLQVATRFTV